MSFQPERVAIASDPFTGIKVYAEQDRDLMQPYTEDGAVRIVVLHGRYINPDDDLTTVEDVEEFEKANAGPSGEWAVFPLFLYDHSGTVYSVSENGANPFACPWDSGRVGVLALKRSEHGDTNYKGEPLSLFDVAKSCAKTYTDWANGNGWGYVVEDADGEDLDSLWGFIGDSDDDYMVSEALESYNGHVKIVTERLQSDLVARIERQGKLAAKLTDAGFDDEDEGPAILVRLAKGEGEGADFLTAAEYLATYGEDD